MILSDLKKNVEKNPQMLLNTKSPKHVWEKITAGKKSANEF